MLALNDVDRVQNRARRLQTVRLAGTSSLHLVSTWQTSCSRVGSLRLSRGGCVDRDQNSLPTLRQGGNSSQQRTFYPARMGAPINAIELQWRGNKAGIRQEADPTRSLDALPKTPSISSRSKRNAKEVYSRFTLFATYQADSGDRRSPTGRVSLPFG